MSDEARAARMPAHLRNLARDVAYTAGHASVMWAAASHLDQAGARIAELEAEVERLRAKIAAAREYIVAIQNSPGLSDTGYHARWLREAVAVLAGEAEP